MAFGRLKAPELLFLFPIPFITGGMGGRDGEEGKIDNSQSAIGEGLRRGIGTEKRKRSCQKSGKVQPGYWHAHSGRFQIVTDKGRGCKRVLSGKRGWNGRSGAE